ncbi:hypothetical protein GE118_01825 [Mycoplasma sp. NEAQ87857]|uniref:hypothetical protein n=1 Tax=Mycoplasma sp. NEAQ87857 TaxID=2683967 RepID=UPI001318E09A|nr:hypothetical protein [Mycoplasma sp. NEAQ87857]QGZ97534.1 hypothetical protein GE118_01825 [Mycoplasma sp. NEAQ87857]
MDKKVADIEKLKLLAEQLIEAKKEVSELNARIKEIVKNTEIEINEPLSNGGRVTYTLVQPKPSFDFKAFSAFLYGSMKAGANYTVEELDSKMDEFKVIKDPKWSLKIKK